MSVSAPFLALLLVSVVISGFWGTGQNFVASWCKQIGVVDQYAIQVATGVFAGGSLVALIYAIWSVLATLLGALISIGK
jgi:hypothetical protein